MFFRLLGKSFVIKIRGNKQGSVHLGLGNHAVSVRGDGIYQKMKGPWNICVSVQFTKSYCYLLCNHQCLLSTIKTTGRMSHQMTHAHRFWGCYAPWKKNQEKKQQDDILVQNFRLTTCSICQRNPPKTSIILAPPSRYL